MSSISRFTSKFKVRTSDSRESSKVTKRPRESLVCNQCRISKLRCDRGQPCGGCIKRDAAASCSYQRSTASNSDTSRHNLAEDRLLHLESMVKSLMQERGSTRSGANEMPTDPLTPPEPPQDTIEAAEYPRGDQIVNGSYVGSTHWSAILDDIQELRTVLRGSSGAPETDAYVPSARLAVNSELIFGSSSDYSMQWIISQYLPPKLEVDRFLSTYFRGESFIVPFVHTSHFQRQYRDFWEDTASVNPLWLSMLFSICDMASLIAGANNQYRFTKSDFIAGPSTFHTAAGQCLVLGNYHRPQKYAVDALAMYGHCKNLQSLDPSREAGAILNMVIRMAYEMGYHRDPDSFGSFTVFEGEMRRRVWAALIQMDLMVSFQLGLPSIICLGNCDSKAPRHILDSDFDVDTKELPPSRPEDQATRLLWFTVKARLMTSFGKVCQDALSYKEKSDDEIFQLDLEIRQMQSTIPDVLRPRPVADSIADPPFIIMTRIYIDFICLKSLCVLHRKYMARGNVSSTRPCVEAGINLVSQFLDIYKEYAPGGQLSTVRWMLTNFTMNDFLLGVMVLCLAVHTRWKRGPQNSAVDKETETKVLTLLQQSHSICLEVSSLSRDARRVSYAIHLTLNGAKISNRLPGIAPQTALDASSAIPTDSGEGQGANPASMLLHQWPSSVNNDETVFGPLDPFNFMGDGLENIDWAACDSQIFGQDATSMLSFATG